MSKKFVKFVTKEYNIVTKNILTIINIQILFDKESD